MQIGGMMMIGGTAVARVTDFASVLSRHTSVALSQYLGTGT